MDATIVDPHAALGATLIFQQTLAKTNLLDVLGFTALP
jgi:hypothetical protein